MFWRNHYMAQWYIFGLIPGWWGLMKSKTGLIAVQILTLNDEHVVHFWARDGFFGKIFPASHPLTSLLSLTILLSINGDHIKTHPNAVFNSDWYFAEALIAIIMLTAAIIPIKTSLGARDLPPSYQQSVKIIKLTSSLQDDLSKSFKFISIEWTFCQRWRKNHENLCYYWVLVFLK